MYTLNFPCVSSVREIIEHFAVIALPFTADDFITDPRDQKLRKEIQRLFTIIKQGEKRIKKLGRKNSIIDVKENEEYEKWLLEQF